MLVEWEPLSSPDDGVPSRVSHAWYLKKGAFEIPHDYHIHTSCIHTCLHTSNHTLIAALHVTSVLFFTYTWRQRDKQVTQKPLQGQQTYANPLQGIYLWLEMLVPFRAFTSNWISKATNGSNPLSRCLPLVGSGYKEMLVPFKAFTSNWISKATHILIHFQGIYLWLDQATNRC